MAFGDVLAGINACLNAASAVALFAGYAAIRRKDVIRHRRLMLTAFTLSAVFLASYLTRFALTGVHRYPVADWTKTVYLTILGTHTVLAAVVVPLVLRSIFLGLKGRVDAHRRIARFTFPIWGYVSVTGVVVYLMLYHLGPSRLP